MTVSKAESIICIIEDDPAVRQSLVALLETVGYQVVSFASAESFLSEDAVKEADFLVIDVRLPGMSGLQLLEQLNATEFTPPAMLITGHANIERRILDDWPNEICVLPKPCEPGQFLGFISQSLSAAK